MGEVDREQLHRWEDWLMVILATIITLENSDQEGAAHYHGLHLIIMTLTSLLGLKNHGRM